MQEDGEMTVKEVIDRVEEIRREASSSRPFGPYLHSDEDALFRDVLRSIAEGTCEDSKLCAFEALKSLDIRFDRWYE